VSGRRRLKPELIDNLQSFHTPPNLKVLPQFVAGFDLRVDFALMAQIMKRNYIGHSKFQLVTRNIPYNWDKMIAIIRTINSISPKISVTSACFQKHDSVRASPTKYGLSPAPFGR